MSFGKDFTLDRGYESDQSMATERAAFIRRTYAHVAGALLALIGLEALLIKSGIGMTVLRTMYSSNVSFLITFAAFIGVSYLAQYWAAQQTSRGIQYLGLAVYVVVMALMLLPLLTIATILGERAGPQYANLIPTAGIMTMTVFAGLTAVVFITKKDFSFLGSLLTVCSFVALGIIVCAVIFGFSLGLLFCSAMIALMAGYILYDTSNIIHKYDTDAHVAAALTLFADIGMMFYYILRILLIVASSRE